MSEYIIGDRIEPSAQPYTLTAADLDHPTTIKDGMATLSTSDTIRMIGGATEGAQPQPILAPFSFIYEGGTHMTTVTERIANITIDSTEEVVFKPAYPFYAVKGEGIKATLIADIADDATQGVYSTDNGNGYTIIKNPKMETTLYLTGTGDVSVWGGENPEACPFV